MIVNTLSPNKADPRNAALARLFNGGYHRRGVGDGRKPDLEAWGTEAQVNPAIASRFAIVHHCRGVTDPNVRRGRERLRHITEANEGNEGRHGYSLFALLPSVSF
jgi:hypothetical protein